MRKEIALPLLALLGGGAGFALRRWQLAAALDADTELFRAGHPATLALLGLGVLMAALFLLLGRGGRRLTDYPSAFRCPSPAYMAVMAAAAFLLFGAAMLGVVAAVSDFTLWRYAPSRSLLPMMEGLSALLCLPAAVAVLTLGRGNYRGTLTPSQRTLVALPAYAALPWLVDVYQHHSRDPQLLHFAFELLAAVFLLLALYLAAGLAYGRPRPAALTFCSLMGIWFGIVSLGDGLTKAQLVRQCAFLLTAAGSLYPLLRARFGLPWPERMPVRADEESGEA